MGSHVAPGSEPTRQEVDDQQQATIDSKVNTAVSAVLDSTIQTKVNTKVTADLPAAAAGAVADFVAAHPLASVVQTKDLASGAPINPAAIYVGDYPAGDDSAD